jgi:Rps23 Pro-64 3,4-dihydroxylase Tpa1-like proline 4-hydroxylase
MLAKFPSFLSQEEYDECFKILMNKDGWEDGHSSNGDGTGNKFMAKDLVKFDIFSTNLLNKIEKTTAGKFKLNRVYANGQKKCQDGAFHQDDTEEHAMTFLLYMNSFDDGGETEFKLDDNAIMKQKAVMNLGVLFDSRIYHRGLAPTISNETRVTVAWKLVEMPKFQFFTEPVPHCIIRNYYNEQELELIWREIEFLHGKLKPPDQTGTARDENGPLKLNRGIFLDDLYSDRNLSNILGVTRKLVSPDIIQNIINKHWFYDYLLPSDRLKDSTLLTHYFTGCYYKPHRDSSCVTCISYLWKEPKLFEGGDLYFGSYKVPIENNCMLIFPSCAMHEVKPVTGEGRYALSQFVNYH